MKSIGLMDIIMDKGSPDRDRIEAIEQLGVIRLREREQRADNLKELSGQKELRRVIQRQRDRLDVRCHAAAVAAKTDSKSVLAWCNEMIQQYSLSEE